MTFHVLHEVGHYLLHHQSIRESQTQNPDRPLYCSSGSRSPIEVQANTYASAFLMSREDIFQMIGRRKSINMLKEGKQMCDYFFVEPWMLVFRLKRLDIRTVYRF